MKVTMTACGLDIFTELYLYKLACAICGTVDKLSKAYKVRP